MEISLYETIENNLSSSKINNSINKSLNNYDNNSFVSKDSNQIILNRLSRSNIELNIEENKNEDFRCLNCYLIPFLTYNSSSGLIDLSCNFGHSKKINIEEFLQCGYNNNFINLKCDKCKTQIVKNDLKNYVYCKECSEILCDKCIQKHDDMYGDHHMVNLDKFDTTCILHNETYDYYCLECRKNICQYCSDDFHNDHKLVDLDDINLKRKEIKIIKENFMKERDNYLNIPNIFNELMARLKDEMYKIISNIKNELKFKESIINTYENKVDNYNAIINLKNLDFNIKPFIVDKNLNVLENIINLWKYACNNKDIPNINVIKKDSKKKVNSKTKKKNVKITKSDKKEKSDKIESDEKIDENNKNEIIENNEKTEKNEIKENESDKKINSNSDKKIINPLKKYNTVYKKNIVPKRMSNHNSNEKKLNNEIIENKNANIVSNINNSNTPGEEKKKVSFNVNKNKPPEFLQNSSKSDKIEEDSFNRNLNIENEIQKNKNKEIKNINKSSNNINYVGPDEFLPPKLSIKSNKSTRIKTKNNLKGDEKEKEKNNNLLLQKMQNIKKNEPLTLKVFNKNQLSGKKDLDKESKKKKEKKILKEIKKIKIEKNQKIKEQNMESSFSEEDEEPEEEEEDDGEEDEEESDEESENEEENENGEEESDENDIPKEKNKKDISKSTTNKKKNITVPDFDNPNNENEDIDNIKVNEENEYDNDNDSSFRHKKIYSKSNISTENIDLSDIFKNKSKVKEPNNFSNSKEKQNKQNKENKEKGNSNEKLKNNININNLKLKRDVNASEFRPKSGNLKIKESNNTVCCIAEIKDNIFACGFLLGEIDIYNVNYLNCLLTILEHTSRINNIFLLKDKSFLTSSYDYTMKKIRINNGNNSYTVEYIFRSLKNIVYKGIELFNNDIISISFKGNINIFRKDNKSYTNYKQHEIADEEIYNVIELLQNKEIAFSTDECLRFFSVDTFKNIDNIHLLEFAKGNNMLQLNKNILGVLLKHDIALINIPQRQIVYKYNLGKIGKPESMCHLKDGTLLIGISNNKYTKIQFLFKQFRVKLNILELMSEKMEESDKQKDDYSRITSIVQLKNKNIVYGTAGFEDYKLVGNIFIID